MVTALLAAFCLQPVFVQTDIVYAKPAGEELKMDIYIPASAMQSDTVSANPAVVLIHGGGWVAGKREDMKDFIPVLNKAGFVVANISYRLAPKHKFPAQWDDVQTAVRFLRANADKFMINPKQIGSCGASAGGHLAMMLGYSDTRDKNATDNPKFSSKVGAVFNIFGPVDATKPFPKAVDNLFVMVLGKPKDQATEELKASSPITHISKTSAPTYTIHGTKDPLVPVEQAQFLKEALQKAGVPCDETIIEGMGHGIDQNDPKVMAALEKGILWLQKYLK